MPYGKLCRSHLNLVSSSCGVFYEMTRINVSRLFYPSAAEAVAAAEVNPDEDKNLFDTKLQLLENMRKIPTPWLSYQTQASQVSCHQSWITDVFANFGKGIVLHGNSIGFSRLCDSLTQSWQCIPRMNSPKGCRFIAASINFDAQSQPEKGTNANSLYILDMAPGNPCCFEVLTHNPHFGWHWRPLPQPPFFSDPEYKLPDSCDTPPFAVIDGTRICLSTTTATYSFDTVTQQWSKAGDWLLPFHSRAEYVPEVGLWLGMCARNPHDMCAIDLSVAGMGSTTPTVQHVGLDVNPPEDWVLVDQALLKVGSGRLCVAKFFKVSLEEDFDSQFVISTGVEVVEHKGCLRLVKHKSQRHCVRNILALL